MPLLQQASSLWCHSNTAVRSRSPHTTSATAASMSSVPDALRDVVPDLEPTGVHLSVKYPTFEAKDGVLVPPPAVSAGQMVM